MKNNFFKTVLAVIILLSFVSSSKAQLSGNYPYPDRDNQRIQKYRPDIEVVDKKLKPQLGIDILAGIPFSDFADGYTTGFGGNLTLEKPVSKEILAGLSIGYIGFKQKELSGVNLGDRVALIPLSIGAKFFISPNFFAGFNAGAGLVVNGDAKTTLLYSPSIGLVTPIQKKNNLGISFKVERAGDISYGGLHISYSFGLVKSNG
ncbi:hypothetical protein [Solitalea canadensis]|uniref:Outer membrane protein beta-barrel domain-containing protein n=1 Tax=Solitalea canadensis (strain ATCC 29591 / DSM 3403 / JCM 21819 / LMG 8368 / NBRC 15130 / NCIMB 12057 / USAM 9D) TaxID=929556 RepID=H8KKX8_SOLCM|nr:hypothetical protein [Solitalea canadensis]AFD08795.1 hypothetical protein Solca_3796 [Solitalea canadensis DSM 3403]